jgi:hypothetical protein
LHFHEKEHKHSEYPLVQNRVLGKDDKYFVEDQYYPGSEVASWSATLIYADLTGLMKYRAQFSYYEPQLGHEDEIPAMGQLRLAIWRCWETLKEKLERGTLQEKLDRRSRKPR